MFVPVANGQTQKPQEVVAQNGPWYSPNTGWGMQGGLMPQSGVQLIPDYQDPLTGDQPVYDQ